MKDIDDLKARRHTGTAYDQFMLEKQIARVEKEIEMATVKHYFETRCNEMPFGKCPACGHEWQIDGYFELDNGDTLECPACEETIHLDRKETSVSFRFKVEAEPKGE